MSFILIRAIAATENFDDVHLGRLLVLLLAANNRKKKNKAIEGITKLAKLDFLLRYPNCLERALAAENKSIYLAKVQEYEKTTIETKMIRFKYGPWDARYRRWLNLLASRGLITVEIDKQTILIDITDKGRKVAELFVTDPAYSDLAERSELVVKTFGNKSASGIKDFIYRVFPELEKYEMGRGHPSMTMKMHLNCLELKCKQEDDAIPFTNISYFYGEMGAGKTSIAKLVDYCLGGDIKLSAALQAEFNSAILRLSVNGNPLSLERVRNSDQIIASWTKGEESLEVVISAKKAAEEIIPGSGLENLSDLIFYLADIIPPKVRRSKKQEDSQLQRLSIRNLLWYCYLDQDSMDSSFYNLDPEANPFKTNASKDVLRYVIGFHQEQVAELEAELQRVREERVALQTGAESLRTALEGEGIADKSNIEARIIELQQELNKVQEIIAASRRNRQQNIPHPVDLLRQKARELAYELNSLEDAITLTESSIEGNKRHLNELTMLKVKYKRISSAKNILIGVEFTQCPRCSQELQPRYPGECPVCGQQEPEEPLFEIKEEVVEADAVGRIAELSDYIERHTIQLKKLKARHQELIQEKQKTDQLINEALQQYDLAYLSSTLEYERQKAELSQTILKLNDYIRLTMKVEELYKRADVLEVQESGIRRKLKEARAVAEGDVTNLRELEGLFLDCILRSKLSGFRSRDHVAIEPPNFLPQVISPDVGEMSITSFENLSSGGKKSIFKACFAIALHRLAIRINAVLPTFMIIDSPMKNISERINREQFEGFHHLLYELAETELKGTQFILIDKEYYPPENDLSIDFNVRHMTTDDPEFPPLIKHYRGH